MIQEIAELIVECSDGGLELREDYRGRGEYSEPGFAIVGKPYEFGKAIADLMQYGALEDRTLVARAFPEFSQDSMGLERVWY